jgi:hypothetical protein
MTKKESAPVKERGNCVADVRNLTATKPPIKCITAHGWVYKGAERWSSTLPPVSGRKLRRIVAKIEKNLAKQKRVKGVSHA